VVAAREQHGRRQGRGPKPSQATAWLGKKKTWWRRCGRRTKRRESHTHAFKHTKTLDAVSSGHASAATNNQQRTSCNCNRNAADDTIGGWSRDYVGDAGARRLRRRGWLDSSARSASRRARAGGWKRAGRGISGAAGQPGAGGGTRAAVPPVLIEVTQLDQVRAVVEQWMKANCKAKRLANGSPRLRRRIGSRGCLRSRWTHRYCSASGVGGCAARQPIAVEGDLSAAGCGLRLWLRAGTR